MQPPVFSWEWFFSEIKTYQEYLVFFFHFLSLIDFALHQQWNYYFNCRKAKCWLKISKSCKGIEWKNRIRYMYDFRVFYGSQILFPQAANPTRKHISPLPRHFVISGFHCNCLYKWPVPQVLYNVKCMFIISWQDIYLIWVFTCSSFSLWSSSIFLPYKRRSSWSWAFKEFTL